MTPSLGPSDHVDTFARENLPPAAQWGLWAASIPAALVVALIFHRFVDTPVQAWLARRLKRPQAATA